jgi:hypothetical protein
VSDLVVCRFCKWQFGSQDGLDAHVRFHHKVSPDVYVTLIDGERANDRLRAGLARARAERDALREAGDRLATEADGLLGEIINADDMVPTTKRYAALEAAVNQYRALADRRGGGEGR